MNYETQVLALIREGNPIQDPDTLTVDQSENAVYLATLTTRSSEMTQLDTKQTEDVSPKRSMVPWLIAAGLAAVIGVAVIVASLNSEQVPVVDEPTPTTAVESAPTTVAVEQTPSTVAVKQTPTTVAVVQTGTIELDRQVGLAHLDAVTVTVTGFPPNGTGFAVAQCVTPIVSASGQCNIDNTPDMILDSSGSGTAVIIVSEGTIGTGTCGEGADECVIAVGSLTEPEGANAPIFFGADVPPEGVLP